VVELQENALKERFEKLRVKILSYAKPTKSDIEIYTKISNEIMERLKKAVPKDVEIILAGSVARGTQIRGSSDIDIFLLFPKRMKERAMEHKGVEIAKSIVDKKRNESYVLKYAEHPYLQLILGDLGVNADIVPAYKISNAKEMGSAVDRTQLHNEFVNNNLSERQKDDVRVLKVFLKGHNIYGAEAKVEGFSGYLCELLIYHFGSFLELIKGMSELKLPAVLDPKTRSFLSGDEYVKRFNSRFIVIDPTDPNRNVAANVSIDSLARFMLASRKLIGNPVEKSFYQEKYSDVNAKKKLGEIVKNFGLEMYVINLNFKDIADDIKWQQAKKLRTRIEKKLNEYSFMPVISLHGVEGNKGSIAFFINPIRLGSVVHRGPSAFLASASEKFIRVHSKEPISVKDSDLFTISKARYPEPLELLRELAKGKGEKLPKYIKKNIRISKGMLDEEHAKIIYRAYMQAFSI